MQDSGWIKVHTSLLDWEWFDDSRMLKVWMYLLLSANRRDQKWHGMVIPRGSLVTSQTHLSEVLHLSTREIRTALERLKATGEVTGKTTNKFSVLTICKYANYQTDDEGSATGKTTGKTTGQRQASDNDIIYKDSIILSTQDKSFVDSIIEKKSAGADFARLLDDYSQKSESLDSGRIAKEAPERALNLFGEEVIGKDDNRSNMGQKQGKDSIVVPFKKIAETWNTRTKGVSKVAGLSEERQNKTRVRWLEWMEMGDPMEVFATICDNIAASPFLQGGGGTFRCNYDWLVKNGNNWRKIYEGNYNDGTTPQPQPQPVRQRAGEIQKDVNSKWKR